MPGFTLDHIATVRTRRIYRIGMRSLLDVAQQRCVKQVGCFGKKAEAPFETLLHRGIELGVACLPDVIIIPVGDVAQSLAGVGEGELSLPALADLLEEYREIRLVGGLSVEGA